MSNWKYKIDVVDLWEKYPEEISFEEFKEELMPILSEAATDLSYIFQDEETMKLEDIIREIEDSEDEDEFDYAWQNLYDWADENRVWIATF